MCPENMARPATPMDQLGPFYKKGAPNTKMMRGARDPGLALGVAGAMFNTRGGTLSSRKNEIRQNHHSGHYHLSGYSSLANQIGWSKGAYEFQSVMPRE